jgi:hypothetical protein
MAAQVQIRQVGMEIILLLEIRIAQAGCRANVNHLLFQVEQELAVIGEECRAEFDPQVVGILLDDCRIASTRKGLSRRERAASEPSREVSGAMRCSASVAWLATQLGEPGQPVSLPSLTPG